jgi:hypothetical protein
MVKRKNHRGGEGLKGRPMSGGHLLPLVPVAYNPEGAPLAKSNYYTISGGSKRRRSRKSKRSRKNKKGGDGVLATAAVPFGILALQRYFKGSKTSKQGVKNMGRSFKRTFRRRH